MRVLNTARLKAEPFAREYVEFLKNVRNENIKCLHFYNIIIATFSNNRMINFKTNK